jgi:hypothetical protein
MNEENNRVTRTNDERRAAIAWLRDVLASIVDVAPLSPWIKEATCRSIRRMPNWLVATWAQALNIDYVAAYRACPDLAEAASSDTGLRVVKEYMETRNAVPLANTLHQLARKVSKLSKTSRLPIPGDRVERQVCALGIASCTPQGEQFIQQSSSILCEAERSNHPLIEYQILLESKQRQKLKKLDAILASLPYNSWVAERIVEIKRWLGLEPPTFHIRYGDRSPLWDTLWDNILTGGGHE